MASDKFRGSSPLERAEHQEDIEAKKVANYVWNGSSWERQGLSSGGGLATVSILKGTTSVATCISGATTSLTLKDSNTSRKKLVITNNSTATLYVKEGATASSIDYAYILSNGDLVIIDDYVGRVDGIWNGKAGSAQVSETT